MKLLLPYIEEISLGIVNDPHTSRPVVLTERVTVCPNCRSLHSLREGERGVYCTDCNWSTRGLRHPLVA